MIILGITGNKQSGKDTIANFIKRWYSKPGQVAHVNFADPLKDEVCKGLGIKRDELEKNKKHYRLILQGWGTDYRRELCGQDYWTKQWLLKANAMPPETDILVVSDIRFLNEAAVIKNSGGVIWRITRPTTESKDLHPSEVEMEQIKPDYAFFNDGTLLDLSKKTKVILHMTIKQHNDRLRNII